MNAPCSCGRDGCYLCSLFRDNPDYAALLREPAPVSSWPRPARWLYRLRTPSETGVGDTLARLFSRLGAGRVERLYRSIVGGQCGCADRQAYLNERYPYA